MTRTISEQNPRRWKADQWSSKVLEFWCADLLNTRLRRVIVVLSLCGLCLVRFLCRFPEYRYTHDAFIFLDGGWRVLHGQRPHVDFSTNLGPLIFLFTALGITLTHHAGQALAFSQALMGVIVAILVSYICLRRMPPAPAILYSTLVVLVAIAPLNTGDEPIHLTSAMFYNRVGYALLGILLVEATQAPKRAVIQGREEAIGGALTGLVCVILLFLKITYFVVAIGLLIALIPYRAQCRQRVIGFVSSAATMLLVVLAYLRFNVTSILSDLGIAKSAKYLDIVNIAWKGMDNIETTALLILLGFLATLLAAQASQYRPLWSRPWAIGITAGLGFALLLTNHQISGQPLNAMIALLVASEVVVCAWPRWKISSVPSPILMLVLLGLVVPAIALLMPSGTAFGFSVLKSAAAWRGKTPILHFDAPAVSDLASLETYSYYASDGTALTTLSYAVFVNDGLDLIRRNSSNETIVSLDFSNPFSFALQRKPPSHGVLCLHYGTTFNDQHKVPPDKLFGNTALVMLPKVFSDESLAGSVERNYGDFLNKRFRRIADSTYWILYRLRSDS